MVKLTHDQKPKVIGQLQGESRSGADLEKHGIKVTPGSDHLRGFSGIHEVQDPKLYKCCFCHFLQGHPRSPGQGRMEAVSPM